MVIGSATAAHAGAAFHHRVYRNPGDPCRTQVHAHARIGGVVRVSVLHPHARAVVRCADVAARPHGLRLGRVCCRGAAVAATSAADRRSARVLHHSGDRPCFQLFRTCTPRTFAGIFSRWAQDNTPREAMFLFPDAAHALYPGIFRVNAARAVYVDWKSGGQVNYLKDFAEEWRTRWELINRTGYASDAIPQYRSLGVDYLVLQAEPPATGPGARLWELTLCRLPDLLSKIKPEIIDMMRNFDCTGDDLAAKSRELTIMLLEESEFPFSRRQFTPGHITCTAVVLDPQRARVLLMFHHRLLRWLLPGGHCEGDDGVHLRRCGARGNRRNGRRDRPGARAPLVGIDVHGIPPKKKRTIPPASRFDLRLHRAVGVHPDDAGSARSRMAQVFGTGKVWRRPKHCAQCQSGTRVINAKCT